MLDYLFSNPYLIPVVALTIFIAILCLVGIYNFIYGKFLKIKRNIRMKREAKQNVQNPFLHLTRTELITEKSDDDFSLDDEYEKDNYFNETKNVFEENKNVQSSLSASVVSTCVENIIYSYLSDNKNSASFYNFLLDKNRKIQNQSLTFYTSLGLRQEICIFNFKDDLVALNVNKGNIITTEQFKQMLIESLDFLSKNSFYSDNLKLVSNTTRYERIYKSATA